MLLSLALKLFYSIIYSFLIFIFVSTSYASSKEKIGTLRIHFVVILFLPGRSSLNVFQETNLASGQTKPAQLEFVDTLKLGLASSKLSKRSVGKDGSFVQFWKAGLEIWWGCCSKCPKSLTASPMATARAASCQARQLQHTPDWSTLTSEEGTSNCSRCSLFRCTILFQNIKILSLSSVSKDEKNSKDEKQTSQSHKKVWFGV